MRNIIQSSIKSENDSPPLYFSEEVLQKYKKAVSLHTIRKFVKPMDHKVIDKTASDKISFLTYIVPAFAEAYKMNVQDAFFYLKKYGAWDFLNEHWWALHTDSTFYAVRDLYEVCYENGGLR